MTPETFDAVAGHLSDALVLLSPQAVILSSNQAAAGNAGLSSPLDLRQRNLADFVVDPDETLTPLLRSARRTSGETIGTIEFSHSRKRMRVFFRRIRPASQTQYFLLMRIQPQQDAVKQFTTLNDKVTQLNGEISRRRTAEEDLRTERDIAAFGRDIGIALVHSVELIPAPARCTELMVERLGAAFARIWLADEEGKELRLVSSSGMYTHLDGKHSCVPFGAFKIGRIAEQQQPHITNAVVGDDEVHDQEWARREGMVAFVGYPLIDGGTTAGVMAIFAKQPLSKTVSTTMGSVANSIALRIRKQAIEDGLARQTIALREAGRRKDEFLAMLSHELRNPLAPVRSGLDLLALENIPQHDTVVLMQQQVEHLVRLVDDLLDVSRIMRGKVQLKRSVVKVSVLIDQAIATLADSLSERKLEVIVPEDPIYVRADAVRIKQVIENLLKNACKYSDAGARIVVAVSPGPDDVRINVRDDGCGIDSELLPYLFDLFTQSPQTLDRSQGGLGIGLTLVKRLVEMHGGRVTVASDGLGKGSDFTVCLPVCDAVPEVSDAAPELGEAAQQKECRPLRILAVDDNRSARTMLARLFEKLGPHQVMTAEDGPSAIEQFLEHRPDLVLLDIGLPGMDGYAVAEAIQQVSADRSCLLVALTGYGRKEDHERSRECGFDVHLVKPPGVQVLRELLQHPKLNLHEVS